MLYNYKQDTNNNKLLIQNDKGAAVADKLVNAPPPSH